MFPSHLHKNILQLDRQISLLESECKYLEEDKRKKMGNLKPQHGKCSKAQSKLSSVNGTKKPDLYNGIKRIKKPTPNTSSLYSSSSLPSNYSKPCSGVCESALGYKTKKYNSSPDTHVCSHVPERQSHFVTKRETKSKCACCKDQFDMLKKDETIGTCTHYEDNKKNHVLHKEVLFSNPGGTIEVTVTQKPNESIIESVPLTKKFTLGNEAFEKDLDSCNCQSTNSDVRGQKWSEILYLSPVKKKEQNCVFSDIPVEGPNRKISTETFSNLNNPLKRDSLTPPMKLARQLPKVQKSVGQSHPDENDLQSFGDRVSREQQMNSCDNQPMKLFQFLINEFKEKPTEEVLKKFQKFLESSGKRSPKSSRVALKKEERSDIVDRNDELEKTKKLYEDLLKEKETLCSELAARDKTISTIKKREDEYLSLISVLKTNLEKSKESAQDGMNMLKELNLVKSKLIDQLKMSEVLKKNHKKMQELMEKCVLENDKLKTEVQIYKLEAQKHDVLLAGKEAEIRRYKEEVESFQKQISEHLATLKTNAQAIDIEKMMEAIVQQSQIFSQADLESIISEKESKGSSKEHNGLIHSSPTSTKTSNVNSSWKQISSIRDSDRGKPRPEVFENGNNFIEVFESEPSFDRGLRETNGRETKKSSFASCLTVKDEDEERDELASNDSEKHDEIIVDEVKKGKPSEKIRSNIDELLQNMKLNWAKEVYGTSTENGTIEEFLNGSQVSGITVDQC